MREGVTNVIRHSKARRAFLRTAVAVGEVRLEGDIEVVGEVSRGDEVVEAADRLRPDVALLDIEMPGMDGLTAAGAIRERLPECRVLLLTTFDRPGYLRLAMERGASGFLLKDSPARELANAIRRAKAGLRTVDPGLAVAALSEGANPLTEREREVLTTSVEEATVAGIAQRRPASWADSSRPRSSASLPSASRTIRRRRQSRWA